MTVASLVEKLRTGVPVAEQFLAWWLGEMSSLLAMATGGRLRPKQDIVIIDLSGGEARFSRLTDQGVVELGNLAAETPDLTPALREAIDGPDQTRKQIVLRLSASHGLTKNLSFPDAAAANLDRVVSFEIARQTPFQPDQVFFDHRMTSRGDKSGKVGVRLAVVPKSAVEDKLAVLRKWRLEPAVLALVGAGGETEDSIRLQVERDGSSNIGAWLRAHPMWIAGGLAVLIALIFLPLIGKSGTKQDLAAQIEAVRADAEQAGALRGQIRDLMGRNSFLHAKKRAVTSMTVVVNEITKLLPDNTWLNRLDIHDGEVKIHGNSPQASTLIGILEQSPYLSDVRFISPVTRDERASNERFEIAATVAPGLIKPEADKSDAAKPGAGE